MKRKSIFRNLGLCLALIFGLTMVSDASPNPNRGKGWKKLGDKAINGRSDQDCINLAPWAGKLKAIQLTTNDDRIDIERVVIYFTNGGRQIVDLRKDWRGGESHVIVLKGGGKRVDKVVYWGSKRRRNHKNRYHRHEHVEHNKEVVVWGLRANSSRDVDHHYNNNDRDRDHRHSEHRRHY